MASDLLRPVNPVVGYLAVDLGRAAYATATRFVAMMALGAVLFGHHRPTRWLTGPLFVASVLLAVLVFFACRFRWMPPPTGWAGPMLFTMAGGTSSPTR